VTALPTVCAVAGGRVALLVLLIAALYFAATRPRDL
jgi:hypothetical protein